MEGLSAAPAEPGRVDTVDRQRLRASQALLSLVVYAVFAVVQHVEVMLGFIDEAASWRLTAWNLGGGVLFYGLIRTGLNLRWRGDPALTAPQMLWAMAGISASYAITGPARGAVMLIMVLVMVFGVFGLKARQARRVAMTGFSMLGAVMAYKGWTDPLRYDPRVECLHFVFAAVVFGAVSTLIARFGRLREQLTAQRRELAEAVQRIQALATRDGLTGLLNRRAALDAMRAELARRDRSAGPLCVALIDLDHFKRINDAHGHAVGDQVLCAFAEVAGATVRAGGLLARWGGEEFLLALPGADAHAGRACLERLRRDLQAQPWERIVPSLRPTFSAGVAVCERADDLEPAIERADRAMYRSKHGGRDRIEVADAAAAAAPAAGVSPPQPGESPAGVASGALA